MTEIAKFVPIDAVKYHETKKKIDGLCDFYDNLLFCPSYAMHLASKFHLI